MSAVVKAGVGLAVAVSAFSVIFALAGLHRSPLAGGLLFLAVAIALNVGAVFWGLKQTAGANRYGKQLLNALLLGVVAGVLIAAFSWPMLTLLFPSYLEESKAAGIEMLQSSGLPAEALDKQVQRLESMTVSSQALQGMLGTLGTSLVAGAIIAIFQRRK
jgi:hypothetical protein